MIVVKVELWSAVDGQKTELARMTLDNIGCSQNLQLGDYRARTFRGRSAAALDRWQVQREGKVIGHRRLALHVWNLVAKGLAGMGYGQESQAVRKPEDRTLADELREAANILDGNGDYDLRDAVKEAAEILARGDAGKAAGQPDLLGEAAE